MLYNIWFKIISNLATKRFDFAAKRFSDSSSIIKDTHGHNFSWLTWLTTEKIMEKIHAKVKFDESLYPQVIVERILSCHMWSQFCPQFLGYRQWCCEESFHNPSLKIGIKF